MIERLSQSYDKPVDIEAIYEALHQKMHRKDVNTRSAHERYEYLHICYNNIFKTIRREILLEYDLVEEVDKVEVIYEADTLHKKKPRKLPRYVISKKLVEEALSSAQGNPQQYIIQRAAEILSRRMREFNAKIRTTKKTDNQKLQAIEIATTNDRTLYHWYKCILLLRRANTDNKAIQRQVSDIVTYIRYNNIHNALTEVKEGSCMNGITHMTFGIIY